MDRHSRQYNEHSGGWQTSNIKEDEDPWLHDCKICWEWEIWGNAQSISSNEGSMASHRLTQDWLGKDSQFLSNYFVFCRWYAFLKLMEGYVV